MIDEALEYIKKDRILKKNKASFMKSDNGSIVVLMQFFGTVSVSESNGLTVRRKKEILKALKHNMKMSLSFHLNKVAEDLKK